VYRRDPVGPSPGGTQGNGGANGNPLPLLIVLLGAAWWFWGDPGSTGERPPAPPAAVDSIRPAAASLSDMGATTSTSTVTDVASIALRRFPYSADACGAEGDPFPAGGLRTQLCHALSLVPYTTLADLAGVPVFREGPHSAAAPAWNDAASFGHYNPDFVRWVADDGVAAVTEASIRPMAQAVYDAHFKTLARVFHSTYSKARREPECFAAEVRRYAELLDDADGLPAGYYGRFFGFMNPGFCASRDDALIVWNEDGVDGTIVQTTVAFWIRRTIDGTASEFARGLERLLSAYDPAALDGSASPRHDASSSTVTAPS
jgi:hypothetical protein